MWNHPKTFIDRIKELEKVGENKWRDITYAQPEKLGLVHFFY
jgi:hypothetical protein